MKKQINVFFDLARERHSIYLKRQQGVQRPWTKDPIFQKYRFCSVFRELDKTTKWFHDHVREPMNRRRDHRLLLATVLFRMFNRIETGEAMFCDDDLLGGHSAFDMFSERGDIRHLKKAIIYRTGKRGPYVTGSYIISAPPGYSKLDGVLQIMKRFYNGNEEWEGLGAGIHDTMGWGRGEEGATQLLTNNPGDFTLEATWNWLRKFDYLGTFHSYEIVSDLRHTFLLDHAPDILTWANPGPGCRRGLNRVMGRDKSDKTLTKPELVMELRELLECSRDKKYWPKDWPKWELRECEHWSCETDKYLRTKNGEGRPRGVFR